MTKFLSGLLAFAMISALVFTGCQDDPYLEEIVDGNPVITPKSRAYITKIQLNTYPQLDPSGNTWDMVDSAMFDTLGLPDIFYNISIPDPQPPILWSQNSHFSNVAVGDTVPFNLLDNYEVVPFGSTIDVNVYDYEVTDSTLMATISFFIGEYPDPANPYPSEIVTNQNGYSLSVFVRWED